jgi:hypothetical protein
MLHIEVGECLRTIKWHPNKGHHQLTCGNGQVAVLIQSALGRVAKGTSPGIGTGELTRKSRERGTCASSFVRLRLLSYDQLWLRAP